VLGTTSLFDEETVSCLFVERTPVLQPESAKTTVIFFALRFRPTDAKHQRSNRINQNKTTRKPIKKSYQSFPVVSSIPDDASVNLSVDSNSQPISPNLAGSM
jgi:hypothetical protein